MGEPYIHVGDHAIPIPYKGETIRVIDSFKVPTVDSNHEGTSHDSYKVPAVDSNHIVHMGGWLVHAPEAWGL